MKVKLFLDEDVHFALAIALRKRGYDVIHAQELQRKGKSDDEQLSYAIKEKRCLFSFNVKDFVLLHNKYVQKFHSLRLLRRFTPRNDKMPHMSLRAAAKQSNLI